MIGSWGGVVGGSLGVGRGLIGKGDGGGGSENYGEGVEKGMYLYESEG